LLAPKEENEAGIAGYPWTNIGKFPHVCTILNNGGNMWRGIKSLILLPLLTPCKNKIKPEIKRMQLIKIL
jgi:hypothetical protein